MTMGPMLLWPGDQVTCPHLGKWATAVQCRGAVQVSPVQLWVAAHPSAGPGAGTAVIML